jgi:hypothetical protein
LFVLHGVDCVLSWQSQPAQTLEQRRIRELIAHDERLSVVPAR